MKKSGRGRHNAVQKKRGENWGTQERTDFSDFLHFQCVRTEFPSTAIETKFGLSWWFNLISYFVNVLETTATKLQR